MTRPRQRKSSSLVLRLLFPALLVLAIPGWAQDAPAPPCQPCAGIRVADVSQVVEALDAAPRIGDEERLYVAWNVDLDAGDEASSADGAAFAAIRDAGGTPWARVRLTTPSPVLDHVDALEAELRAIAALVRRASETDRVHVQLDWAGADVASAADWAFVIKRAAVAVTGARGDARVIVGPVDIDLDRLKAFYAEDVAAYVDGIAVRPSATNRLIAFRDALAPLDPGTPLVLDALAWPEDPRATLARAAEATAEGGIAITFFDRARPSAVDLVPLKVLAREFQGDLSHDPYSKPKSTGGEDIRSWAFVRGEDLGLRVIAEAESGIELMFDDSQLRRPELVDLADGSDAPAFSQRRTGRGGLAFSIEDGPVTLARLSRATAAELEGVEDLIEVADERTMPVEEILRRLQAFEDDQARRLDTYRATNTTHLRFQTGTDGQAFEATFRGAFFFRQGVGYDWAWQEFLVNGVRWKGERVPQIPLIQPQKVATLPLLINFSKAYRYSLRGTAIVDDRDCWVVDFAPLDATEEASRFRGTVWIDREHYGRVRTKAIQLGLEGEVLSNEETLFYRPVAMTGESADWSAEALWLPTRTVSHQLLSLLESTLVAEREVLLDELVINPRDFDAQREAVLASDATMVRDTDAGLRYLVKDKETGERRVQENLQSTRLFLLGGVFYDQSFDFPLPLAGINYFNLDWRGTGTQVNVFFAGALLTADIATPSLFGSKWTASADLFALAIAGEDEVFRGDDEIQEEAVESRPASIDLALGRQLGTYGKLDLRYELDRTDFSRADDTADDFVVPSDHFTQTFEIIGRYNRDGYRLALETSFSRRSEWEAWGFADNPDFDPEKEEFTKWRAAFGKTWYLPNFRKFSLELEYVDGEDLDRFSKYQFGFFSDVRIHGYQSDKVRAERAFAAHLSYGVNFGEAFRLELVGDAALANDELSGLEDELLAGIGLVGTFIGPWNTIVNLDVGVAVDGPDDGVSAFIAFLKLFGGRR